MPIAAHNLSFLRSSTLNPDFLLFSTLHTPATMHQVLVDQPLSPDRPLAVGQSQRVLLPTPTPRQFFCACLSPPRQRLLVEATLRSQHGPSSPQSPARAMNARGLTVNVFLDLFLGHLLQEHFHDGRPPISAAAWRTVIPKCS